MGELYERIALLCEQRGIKPGKMCTETGISRGNIGDLKMGRIKKLSAENLEKVAKYFGVTTDYLLKGEDTEKAPVPEDKRQVSDDDIMFALWGDASEIDKDDLEDVKRYAAFVRERKQKK